jgi:hypothetical protein
VGVERGGKFLPIVKVLFVAVYEGENFSAKIYEEHGIQDTRQLKGLYPKICD